ncbi:MAG: aldehyde dehydrogenase [Alistipes sp.]|nr:aldehyde dehydrogenase [Alistipes sp.]
MKSTATIFEILGAHLALFGEDSASQQALHCALEQNEWFSEGEIRYALAAIAEQMLDADKIEAWLAHYPAPTTQPQRIGIIMAGNIPLVGFADLMCVIASGNIACVKYSSKDSAMMHYVVALLREIEPALRIEEHDDLTTAKVDALIATGGEAANIYFRTAFGNIPSLLRGSRHSVAVLDGSESAADMEALADDIFTYSGLGCRNVSLIFVPRGMELSLPQHATSTPYHNNYLQRRALMTMQGEAFDDLGNALAVRREASFSDALCCLNIAEYDDMEQVREWLHDHDEQIQCIASHAELHPRTVPLGRAQFPALDDYADGRDTMTWLHSLAGNQGGTPKSAGEIIAVKI